ncbi:MAG: hypothetical protein NTW32_09850 [Chloroflexi bacterium]|nr:hypothetical protein [Chloroflexota bacterium]
MHINRDALIKLAKDTVEKRFAHDPNVTAVFLVGSLRPEHAVVESAADVDLLVLHNGELPRDREIIKLSNEYHIDISYENASLYAQPRELRGDGWRGWAMWDPHLLYQKGRFFEYTQSVVRAQFEEPLNIIKRSRYFAEPARAAWTEMQMDPESASPLKILTVAFNAANSLACLSGTPIPERRLLAEFPARANILDQADLIQTIFRCVSNNVSVEKTRQWLPEWEHCFLAAAHSPADLRLHSARRSYYKIAIENQINSDLPRAALWPMLHTWALASENGTFTEDHTRAWQSVCAEAGLDTEGYPERLQALDNFLDRMEEIFEQLMVDNGL